MATIQRLEITDDIDGEVIDIEDLDRVQFSHRGVDYEIDLRSARGQEFDEDMARWISSARRVGGKRRPRSVITSPTAHVQSPALKKQRQKAIREWALSEGMPVSNRGRISQEVVDQYDALH